MKTKFKNLLSISTILSVPGMISIFVSLLSIPIHLNFAGPESYGNYIIFHFILMISINLNLGIGKSAVISINNFFKKRKEISYDAIIYTRNVSLIIFLIFLLVLVFDKISNSDFLNIYKFTKYLFIGSIITIFFMTLEGILQGNRKFKSISFLNLLFFNFSFALPSILLIYDNKLTLENLITISILIKLISVLIMFFLLIKFGLVKKSNNQVLFENLRINSKWITLNSLLIQFYDLFDKYLIKFFLGPIAVAAYSIPQQLTGKLSIISKSFSAFLLPDLSKKKIDNDSFNFSLQIFLKFIPLVILMTIPLYPLVLKFWLGNSYSETIHQLTKVFSISVIFSCASHILITKFEASKSLNRNLKIELLLMPFFLFVLYFLTSGTFTLIQISFLILLKELILFFLRLSFFKNEIKKVKGYYFLSLYFILMLYFSFNNENLYYCFLILLILNFFRK